jgi:hypothetical protein
MLLSSHLVWGFAFLTALEVLYFVRETQGIFGIKNCNHCHS